MNEIFEWRASAKVFLDTFFRQLCAMELIVEDYELDHVCYRVDSLENYRFVKQVIAREAKLLSEALIGGRPIATYKLEVPLVYESRKIFLVEIPSPKLGRPYPNGFEHAEFVINEAFENLAARYPKLNFDFSGTRKDLNPELALFLGEGLSVKFHHASLEKIIELENAQLSG